MLGTQLAPRYTEGVKGLLYPNSLTCFVMKIFLSVIPASHMLLSSPENGCMLSLVHPPFSQSFTQTVSVAS